MAIRRVGIFFIGLSLAAATAIGPMTTVAAAATSPVKIVKVQYDSAGKDTRTNASLNAEYVVIKNISPTAQALTGWTLRDAQNHVFTFPTFRLAAGKSVTVHTGRGAPSATDRFYNSGFYIWNNNRDTATLRTARGSAVASCSWTATGAGATHC